MNFVVEPLLVAAVATAVSGSSMMGQTNLSGDIGVRSEMELSNLVSLAERSGFGTTNPVPDGTNMLVFKNDKRGGLDIVVDECLPRALTNSCAFSELQKWAIQTILQQQASERRADLKELRRDILEEKNIPEAVRTIGQRIPSFKFSHAELPGLYLIYRPETNAPQVRFFRNASGAVEAIFIGWDMYGIVVGEKTYVLRLSLPMYQRKLAAGIYVFHGHD